VTLLADKCSKPSLFSVLINFVRFVSVVPRLRRVVVPGSVPGQYMWDLWWTKWHWDKFLSEYFVFPSHYYSTNTPYAFIHLSRTLYTQPVFYALSLNAPYHFTLLLKLRPMVFALTFFDWFISVYVSLFSYVSMIYDLRPPFSGKLWHKTRS